jgi:2-polyprenyl-6-methoxyphenol hydroxylase-like FAD-dependent oxidoreductase
VSIVLLGPSVSTPQAQSAPVPLDPITAIVDAFRTHDIVALSDAHGNEQNQQPPIAEDYIVWAIGCPKNRLPHRASDLEPAALHQLALAAVRDFHPVLRRFVADADVRYTMLTPLAAATKPSAWPAPPITLMGDAVHVMPPTGAHGGNTALRDAALLADTLQGAVAAGTPVRDAIARYQSEMVAYAFKEVDASIRTLRRINASNPLFRFAMFRAMPWLRARIKGRLMTNQEWES